MLVLTISVLDKSRQLSRQEIVTEFKPLKPRIIMKVGRTETLRWFVPLDTHYH
jgi:hypothetical protein